MAPYALFSGHSRGRRFPETEHPLRTEFQRDRDRVIHSGAFRRLEYKTQVFVNGADDHFRTRLTHTIEVAGIARTIARSLELNEDLAEATALAHDLGHPPFGHCGETTLDELLQDHGGFDHNRQALKIVDELEEKYPGYNGLNLTWELRSGLLKHRQPNAPLLDGQPLPPQPGLEAQVADIADDLTYYSHDLDDAIRAGLIKGEDVQDLRIWRLAQEEAGAPPPPDDRCYFPFMVRNIINLMVRDVVESSRQRLDAAGVQQPSEAEALPEPLIAFGAECAPHCAELREFLFQKMYWHRAVMSANDISVKCMRQLYHHLYGRPELLGRKAKGRIERDGLAVAAADYLAGMTDRYAIQLYRSHFGDALELPSTFQLLPTGLRH